MAALPPFLILIDLSALLASSPREWQEFARLGECFIPKASLDEMQVLCDHAPDPDQARTAKEFVRFFPGSGWQPTSSIAQHQALKPTEGHTMSKKARLSLATAQAAYGLSRNRSDGLVVVVANDQGLIQRLRTINTHNLCGIPLTVMVQWSRTQRKPAVVTNHLHLMRLVVGAVTPASSTSRATSVAPSAPPRPSKPSPRPVQRSNRRVIRPDYIFYNLLTLVIVAIAVLGVWRVLHPPSFARFWHQLPLVNQVSPTRRLLQ